MINNNKMEELKGCTTSSLDISGTCRPIRIPDVSMFHLRRDLGRRVWSLEKARFLFSAETVSETSEVPILHNLTRLALDS